VIRKTKPTKAWVAGALAALAFAVPVVDDGVSLGEALGIALAALAGFQGVYWTTNKPKADA
jgi:hypothetical protein